MKDQRGILSYGYICIQTAHRSLAARLLGCWAARLLGCWAAKRASTNAKFQGSPEINVLLLEDAAHRLDPDELAVGLPQDVRVLAAVLLERGQVVDPVAELRNTRHR